MKSRAGPAAQSCAQAETPQIDWRGGVLPVSRRYDDPYFSALDGLAEARHVHLDAGRLPARMRGAARFHAAELGFGAGLNALALWQAWLGLRAPGGVLHFTSFEAQPLSAADMARAHAPFAELAPLSDALCRAWAGAQGAVRRVTLDGLRLRVIVGDARASVPATGLLAQAWLLDGFAPRRNPEMWEPPLLAAIARRTAPGGIATTYSSAGMVRRGLAAAGFAVAKRPGFGFKRSMCVARLRPEGAA